ANLKIPPCAGGFRIVLVRERDIEPNAVPLHGQSSEQIDSNHHNHDHRHSRMTTGPESLPQLANALPEGPQPAWRDQLAGIGGDRDGQRRRHGHEQTCRESEPHLQVEVLGLR
ncbi:MAG: hypothetical protein QG597_3149, partial [Actinomycetota bacterium]|nr:hypothetical protein [Actinomycetota bacterium]